MKLHTQITIPEQIDVLEKLLRNELARTHERSTTRLEEQNGESIIIIDADDVSALRAAVNAITSILKIHEKTHER